MKINLVAIQIMQKCVKGFEKLALAVLRTWGKDSCEITLFGGLKDKIEIIKEFLSPQVKEKITFLKPTLPIIYGTIRNLVSEPKFVDNFLKTYSKIM